MRYTESKDQSAAILRVALGLMGQHDAALNPLTYAVWYEHAAGINGRLSRAIEECLRTEPRLSDATIARLHREHVAEPDARAVRHASGELERLISGMAESAGHTGDDAGQFGQTLGDLEEALQAAAGPALEPVISRALEGTATMRESAIALQRQVAAGQAEIERLRFELGRERDEALLDPLTRVLNRKGFDQRLEAMLALPPMPGASHGLVMLDIDRFKTVNDSYGHMMGDRVLQVVAEVLANCLVDPAHCVARYGGEEFALLLPRCAPEFPLALAQACRERVKALKVRDRRTQGVVLVVTISAGVATVRAGDDAQELIARADAALYAAKKAGRDRVACG